MTSSHLVSIASIPESPVWSLVKPSFQFPESWQPDQPKETALFRRLTLSVVLNHFAKKRPAVSGAENLPDAAQITTVYLLFTHVLKEQQASILIRLYRRAEFALA